MTERYGYILIGVKLNDAPEDDEKVLAHLAKRAAEGDLDIETRHIETFPSEYGGALAWTEASNLYEAEKTLKRFDVGDYDEDEEDA
jgi:hypothetical protein